MSHSCSKPHVAWSNWKRTIDWSKGRRTGQALHRSSACVHTLPPRPFARSGIGTDLTEFTPSLRVPFILPRAKFTPICSPSRPAPSRPASHPTLQPQRTVPFNTASPLCIHMHWLYAELFFSARYEKRLWCARSPNKAQLFFLIRVSQIDFGSN